MATLDTAIVTILPASVKFNDYVKRPDLLAMVAKQVFMFPGLYENRQEAVSICREAMIELSSAGSMSFERIE